MANELATLTVVIGANTEGFMKKLEVTQQRLKTFNRKFGDGLKFVGGGMAALGGTIVAAGVASVKSYADMGDSIDEMSQRTGFAAETISKLNYAADLSGTSIGAVENASKKLSVALVNAGNKSDDAQKQLSKLGLSADAAQDLIDRVNDGVPGASDRLKSMGTSAAGLQKILDAAGGTGAAAFERLGLSVDALAKLKPEEQFMTVAKAVAAITDPTERAAAAVAVFGKAGTDMLPMFAGGVEGFNAMSEAAVKAGAVFTSEGAAKAAVFSDAMANMEASITGLKMTIATAVMPVLQDLINWITPMIQSYKDFTAAHPTLVSWIFRLGGFLAVVGGAMLSVGMAIGPLTKAFPLFIGVVKGLGVALQFLAANPVGLVITAIAALVAIGILVWKNWDTIKAKAIEIWNAIAGFFKNIWDGITRIFKDNWQKILNILFPTIGLAVLIAQNWGAITTKVKEIWNAVTGFFSEAWGKITGIFREHWDKILAILFPAVGIPVLIARNWDTVKTYFSGFWTAIKDGFKNAFNFLIGLAEGWVNMFIKGINFIIGALNKISLKIPDWVPGIGGKSFGVAINQVSQISLPRLDAGGIVSPPGIIAQVGERRPEAVIPLEDLNLGGAINVTFGPIQLDGYNLTEVIERRIDRNMRSNRGV